MASMNVWDEWQLSWRDAGRCGPQDPLPSVGINVVIKRHPATTMRSGTEGCTSISGQGQGIIRNYWDRQLTNGEDAGCVSLAHSLGRRARVLSRGLRRGPGRSPTHDQVPESPGRGAHRRMRLPPAT